MSIGTKLGQYILQTQFKKNLKTRVDSRLNLTFGKLVSKSTHQV